MFYQKKKDSRSERIYYYSCESIWDKEAKKYVCKRKLIGRGDLETETVVPTKPRTPRAKEEAPVQEDTLSKRGRKKKPADYQELYEKEKRRVEELEALRRRGTESSPTRQKAMPQRESKGKGGAGPLFPQKALTAPVVRYKIHALVEYNFEQK